MRVSAVAAPVTGWSGTRQRRTRVSTALSLPVSDIYTIYLGFPHSVITRFIFYSHTRPGGRAAARQAQIGSDQTGLGSQFTRSLGTD